MGMTVYELRLVEERVCSREVRRSDMCAVLRGCWVGTIARLTTHISIFLS